MHQIGRRGTLLRALVFCCIKPHVMELGDGCGRGVVGEGPVVVGVEEVVRGEMLQNLKINCIFNHFPNLN